MKFKKGDNLQCISVNAATPGITIGATYVCLNYINCTDQVLVLNDNNVKQKYSSPHFIKA